MAKSSIHIKKAVNGSPLHNNRENFSYSVVFVDEKNECTLNASEAYKIYRSELLKRSEAYTQRTKQKLQKSAVTQLSAVVNLQSHHTLEDLKPITEELEKLFDTKIFQVAIHRDEGKLISKKDGTEYYSGIDFFMNPQDTKLYYDKEFKKLIPLEDYEIVKNYHAHLEMMGLDSQGNAIRQKMNNFVLSNLQTFVANTLGMERGNSKGKKRKDIHEFKALGAAREQGKREALASQEDLKAEIATIRGQLKAEGAKREDYAKLEQIIKELKEEAKAKTLTISEMEERLKELKNKINKKDGKLSVIEEKLKHGLGFTETQAISENPKEITENSEKLKKYGADWIIANSKVASTFGKKIDEKLLAENINKVLSVHDKLHQNANAIIQKLDKAREIIKENTEELKKQARMVLDLILRGKDTKPLPNPEKPQKEPKEEKEEVIKKLEEMITETPKTQENETEEIQKVKKILRSPRL